MESVQGVVVLDEVVQVRRDIERWRAGKRCGGDPMPARIWSESLALARKHGTLKVAKALHLDYGALRKRLQREDSADESTSFVELQPVAVVSPPTTGTERRVEVELSRPDGARMVVRAGGSETLDLVGLAEAFWGRASR